jgi:plastocyanin
MFAKHPRLTKIIGLFVLASLLLLATASIAGAMQPHRVFKVIVPEEDRFSPYSLTIHAGDVVQWINQDTDDHTIVTNNAFTTADHKGLNILLPGTDSNNGKPGIYSLRFSRPGVFAYYCRFHAQLDSFKQPIAPGPDGGIQDANGNFGTPMNGVITVLP